MREKIDALTQNLARTIVGKNEAVRLVLVALLGGGHALLEDVPGVGKTLLAKSLARSVDGKFQLLLKTPSNTKEHFLYQKHKWTGLCFP